MNGSDSVKTAEKTSRIGAKIWVPVILFGLIGQIAWIIENMYFATFAQNLFDDTAKFGNTYYVATTLMVIFSAITATITTIFAGGLCDKTGKRKPFIAFGYIIWGVTIMLFAAIPINFDSSASAGIVAMLVIFDCIMTFFGSTANDAAFNTWLVDVTEPRTRGRINGVLSIMPILAMVIAIVVAMFTFDKGAENALMYKLFFIIIGIVPIIAGIIAVFTLKDPTGIVKDSNPDYLKETFYGFRPSVIRENKMAYVTLSATCILGIAQQVFMSYLINFIAKTLGITDYILPLGVVIVGSAIITGVLGIFYDKVGRKNFYFPLLAVVVVGLLVIYFMKFMPSSAYLPLIIVGGIIMMGALLAIGGAMTSTFQDYIPKGYEGRFQGVKMCFTVLIPMIIGPIVSLIIGINSFDGKDATASTHPPFEMFLVAACIALFAAIPMFFIRKDADRLRNASSTVKVNDDAPSQSEEISVAEKETAETAISGSEEFVADNKNSLDD